MRIDFGKVSVNCTVVGSGRAPWDDKNELRTEYEVVVVCGRASYRTRAWGSIHDYGRRKTDCPGISAMVVDELLSANADPDEFLDMVIGESRGRDALRRGQQAEHIIAAARKFSYDNLVEAVRIAEEKGLR